MELVGGSILGLVKVLWDIVSPAVVALISTSSEEQFRSLVHEPLRLRAASRELEYRRDKMRVIPRDTSVPFNA